MPRKKVKKNTAKTNKTTKVVKKSRLKKLKSPKKKTKTKEKIEKDLTKKSSNQKFYDQLKLNESYVSLVLGAVVVVAIFSAILVFVYQNRGEVEEQRVLNSVVTPTPEPERDVYIVQEDESLWDIAVRFYGDGFSYTKIVEANPGVITNPDYVPPGTEIIIPDVSK